ncbi:MAG TPA: V-type ATP synthase subunit I [Candidatus Wunengus sp. YC60]|uniref:V-type ATP synthase subunit I n=1 Tax=Candidatus Wunengus sp. YC60 TaxID=3367697 RepID=UPI004026D3C8
MAIDKLNKLTILLPSKDSRWFLSKLYQLNIVHIIDTFSHIDNSSISFFQRFPTVIEEIEKNIQKVNTILSILKTFFQKKKSFVEGIFPIPLQVTQEELDIAFSRVDIESIHKECQVQYEKYAALQKQQKQRKEEIDKLTYFLPLADEFTQIGNIRNVSFFYCQVSESRWNRFLKDEPSHEFLSWQIVSKTEEKLKILFAYLNHDKDAALRVIAKFDLKEIPFPVLSDNIKDHFDKLTSEMASVIQEQGMIRQRLLELSSEWYSLEILLGYWENERNKMIAQHRCAISKRFFVLVGYVKTTDRLRLDSLLNNEFPQASVIYEEPSPIDKVPVSITLNRFFKPAQLLINMFGLPNYFTFDPTPFVIVSFLIFFGLCFGDVFYGLFLTAFSAWMVRKYRHSEPLSNFMKLFFYAGISTMIFGALTGGWAGDLYNPMYLGENNILLKVKERLSLLDPLSKPVIALLVAIGLGVLNQFYGIILRMYGEILRKNFMNAICDGLLWLILLPGFLILTATIFLKIPEHIVSMGKYLAIIGAAGLISTQGRNEKGIAGKIFTGIVSLYGIVGTYGCSGFIGDILSYTRILALGLTTSIIGMAFNIVASLFKTGTFIGVILFIIILVTGHMFNFVMSILGAFIHPARLIFLEFFGRFYEGGAPKFQPYGFGNQRIILKENG